MSISLKELSERINGSGVPIGTVVAFRGNNIPSGWLLCDGRSCSGTELQKQLGLSNVPDLRGRFIRMVGGNAAGLGGTQEDCIRNITGYFDTNSEHFDTSAGGPFTKTVVGNRRNVGGDWGSSNRVNFDVSRSVPTGPENRPVNMAMNFIIKANYSLRIIRDHIISLLSEVI